MTPHEPKARTTARKLAAPTFPTVGGNLFPASIVRADRPFGLKASLFHQRAEFFCLQDGGQDL